MDRRLTLTGTISTLAILASCLFSAPTQAEEKPLYDWTVQIETKRLERQFEYEGSHLRLVERLDVDYYYQDQAKAKTIYESAWYHNGKPLGLERFNYFNVPPGQGVCIKVVHKTENPTAEEQQAAANMIVRVWMEAYLNRSGVVMVKVPQRSFSQIINYLHGQGYVTTPETAPEDQGNIPMQLLVEAEQTGQTVLLNYN